MYGSRSRIRVPGWAIALAFALSGAAASRAAAQAPSASRPAPDPGSSAPATTPIRAVRAPGAITVDGRLDDPGWIGVPAVDTFVETRPGDNVPPAVRTTLRLAYDDRYLYAAFELEDPEPSRIRSYFSDRDDVGTDQDYACLFLDTRHDGRTVSEFCSNPRGVQYDAVQNDATGEEDASPDFYWDSAGSIGPRGWILEIRIPFSTLRYGPGDRQTWGIIAMRNYTREDRHTVFTSGLPRGSPCFVCHERELLGLAGLPTGAHFVAAPYASLREEGRSEDGAGARLRNGPVRGDGGLDLKWIPNADTAFDATIRPDFSQIESDATQISANARFALFYPEKRPFFLEGAELFRTPIPAIYTRTLTSPRWGVRATGKSDGTAYTVLVADDRGGGTLILPGPEGSGSVPQDFESYAVIARVRRDIGRSFASFLLTDRESVGAGHNRVAGPDFQWVPGDGDRVTGQFLVSQTRGPGRESDRPGATDHALDVSWNHGTGRLGWYLEYADFGDRFRADDGFVPQVGYRRAYALLIARFNLSRGFFSRLAPVLVEDYSADRHGRVLLARAYPGVRFVGSAGTSGEVDVFFDRVRAGGKVFDRRQLSFQIESSPAAALPRLFANGFWGQEVDFANVRPGRGGQITAGMGLRLGAALAVDVSYSRGWLDVDAAPGAGAVAAGKDRRLFTADVARVKATWAFGPRTFVRTVVDYASTSRDPTLYRSPVAAREGSLLASALFAVKVNWQTVLFVGYGDDRLRSERDAWMPSDRHFFLKASYAFSR
ncbi:MAG: DUF5916 domain-containing protein [Acidobacteriota bacterium]